MVTDPHKVLGVPPGASQDEIKKAYRKKAKEYHPDLHPNDPEAAKKMNEINEAYDMLMNPEKHRARQEQQRRYQNQGQGYGQGQYGPGGWYTYYGDIDFEDIFGGRQTFNANPKHEPSDSPEVSSAVDLINSGRYNDALRILQTVSDDKRNARWFYLNSLCHYGLGNMVQAIDFIEKAYREDPDNQTYKILLQNFKQYGHTYTNNSRGYNTRVLGLGKLCCRCAFLYCLCRNPYFCLFC
jgi:molecular chaperone DnaJ